MTPSPSSDAAGAESSARSRGANADRRRSYLFLAGVTGLALLVRLLAARQSLWCDEMASLVSYVTAPWHLIVAAGPGQYVPNDHVFFTILAKLCLSIGNGGKVTPVARAAWCLRMPSIFAGAFLPLAVAWPLRRTGWAAGLLAVLICLHPWLVVIGGDGRGYSLMLLLGVVATNLLPTGHRRRPLAYGLILAAAIYTVSVAVLLIPAHAAVIILSRRTATGSWLRGTGIGLLAAGLLYLPMAGGVISYYRHPMTTPDRYADFAAAVPQYALAGRRLPFSPDPAPPEVGPITVAVTVLIPLGLLLTAALVGGGPARVTPDVATAIVLIGLVSAAFVPSLGQVRLYPWAAVAVCSATAAVLTAVGRRTGMRGFLPAASGVAGWMVWIDVTMPPTQPVREGLSLADRIAPPGRQLVVAFLTADTSAALYGAGVTAHRLLAAEDPPRFARTEQLLVRTTGHRPWLVVSYEDVLHDYTPAVWDYLSRYYRLQIRLPGRISSVAIYAPRDE